MEGPDPKVLLVARDEDGRVIRSIQLSPAEWYDGDVPFIDDDPPDLARLGVRTIEGYRTNPAGEHVQEWRNTYDSSGNPLDMEFNDDLAPAGEMSIPTPKPGESAGDQLVRLGILKPKST